MWCQNFYAFILSIKRSKVANKPTQQHTIPCYLTGQTTQTVGNVLPTTEAAVATRLWACIRKVPGSDLGQDVGYEQNFRDFL
jgi:hypothetical protein